nr:flagellar motor protein MotB [Legionella pneumophila]
MKSKQKKTEEHQDSHRWVVSYADFITLLFAFFCCDVCYFFSKCIKI